MNLNINHNPVRNQYCKILVFNNMFGNKSAVYFHTLSQSVLKVDQRNLIEVEF